MASDRYRVGVLRFLELCKSNVDILDFFEVNRENSRFGRKRLYVSNKDVQCTKSINVLISREKKFHFLVVSIRNWIFLKTFLDSIHCILQQYKPVGLLTLYIGLQNSIYVLPPSISRLPGFLHT